jgi:signal peptidase I
VAVILSLLAAGTGHLYAGAPRRALGWWVASVLAPPVLLGVAMVLPPKPQLLLVLALVAFPVGIAIDAAAEARRKSLDRHRRPYQKWYVYAAVILLNLYAVTPLVFGWVKRNVSEAFRIPSGGMAPALEIGDQVLATPFKRAPVPGRVRVYRSHGKSFIQRVVALPGDTIAMTGGQLLVNRRPVNEPYAQKAEYDPVAAEFLWQHGHLAPGIEPAMYRPSLQTWGPLLVPIGHVFVLGDNRGNSADSRYIGFIPVDSVVARPTAIYFSRDVESGKVRWSRIGRSAGG